MQSLKNRLAQEVDRIEPEAFRSIFTIVPTNWAKFSNSLYTDSIVCIVEIIDIEKSTIPEYRGVISQDTSNWLVMYCRQKKLPVVIRHGFRGIKGSPHLNETQSLQAINHFLQNYKRRDS